LFLILCARMYRSYLADAGTPPPLNGGMADPRNALLPGLTCVTMPNSVVLRSNYTSVIMEICQKICTHCVPPFKVTRCHWNRHGSIGYLCPISCMIHSNYGSTSYRFLDKKQWLQYFLSPCIFSAHVATKPPRFSMEFLFGSGARTN